MIKDAIEDHKRYKSDNEENNRLTECVPISSDDDSGAIDTEKSDFNQNGVTAKSNDFQESKWRQIKVGQIVKVHENDYFPCDIVLLNTSLPKGICYIETKSLDGETNLKHKQAEKKIM